MDVEPALPRSPVDRRVHVEFVGGAFAGEAAQAAQRDLDVAGAKLAVSIEITSTPVLSYALAHNRVPVVSRLAITNFGGPVRAATVRLGVRDAEGPIAKPVELLADLDEGRTTVLTDLGLVMDPAAMLHVEEQRPGVIDVEVEVTTDDGVVLLGEGSRVVQVLAAQQWLATPVPLALEMLAAHVMPNHPAVTALVSEAAGVLEQKTGSGALVGPYARLRGGAVLEADVHIGNFVEVKNATLAAGAKANHLAYIGDASVGERVNFGAGSITANYDGRKKHRTKLGKSVKTGVHTSLVAPLNVGDRAYTGAGSTITGDVPEGALGIAREKQKNIEGYADRVEEDSQK